MKICYFGTYSKEEGYPRNRVIIKGLRDNGVSVKECHVDLWKSPAEKITGIKTIQINPKLLFRIILSYLNLIINFFKIGEYDVLIVGYVGHFDIFVAKTLNIFRRKPIIFDAFLSLYDTAVNERKIISKKSLKAKILWLVDKYSCLLADTVLLDSEEHIQYFAKEFKLPKEKFLRVLVGEDDTIFKPIESKVRNSLFEVLFFGTYISLHGIEYIIRAAKLLAIYPDIHFTLIGDGQLYSEIYKLAKEIGVKNIDFINKWLNYDELKKFIACADICLGIFGNTEKAKRIIPCKVYDCLSMAKPVITGNSPAAREILIDKKNAILCEMGNSKGIAESILLLCNNNKLREEIAMAGYDLFCQKLSPKNIAQDLLPKLNDLILKINEK